MRDNRDCKSIDPRVELNKLAVEYKEIFTDAPEAQVKGTNMALVLKSQTMPKFLLAKRGRYRKKSKYTPKTHSNFPTSTTKLNLGFNTSKVFIFILLYLISSSVTSFRCNDFTIYDGSRYPASQIYLNVNGQVPGATAHSLTLWLLVTPSNIINIYC